MLADSDYTIRREVAKALGRLRDPQAVQPLTGILADKRREVCRVAVVALGKIEKAHPGAAEPAVSELISLLNGGTRSIQAAAAKTLERIRTAEAHEAVWQRRFPGAESES